MYRRSLLAASGALALPRFAAAQGAPGGAWPARPVRIIVPFPPGGSNDAVARPLAEALQRSLGQPFVIDNRGGAGSTIGSTEVARAPSDGHTLMVTSSTFATSAAVQTTPYDAARDFETVALLATAPLVMLASPDFPPNTMAEAVAHIRANPGKIDYGSAGPGSIGHMGGALFALRAGRLDMQHVPYRGTGPVLNDLAAGIIQLTFTTITAAAGLVSGGRVKLLGWTSENRPASGPAAPTPRESGLPDYEAGIWWGLLARRGIPAAIRARLNAAANEALAESRFAANLANEGATPARLSPEEGERFLQADLARWRDLAIAANIRVE
ncbi:tripartite tricarboxylate transporter substrate-binding protein [Plastoroseomonas hellenica]|uniref:tripartite tricarboxylate transporter substrate-binding protein n=1 Tax=Plastoroseomonas hellenica TaxID=2687306 RepID=UPI001BA91C02|nr:tripartite tricarboxylate transporter substrate-binding protein [Plastoroseomonas hellenica]MBR0646758.1 tripartite tricarboxylate transporter substrate binding protein [Plastoroseomonas hellenica]